MDGPPPSFTAEQLAFLSHDDRGPALIAISWCLTVFASIFLALRVYCKLLVRGRRGLWWDDWILLAAWALLVIDAALATRMVTRYKYGVHIWDFTTIRDMAELDAFVLMAASRATVTITAIAWTKTAFAITLLRLTEGWVKRLLWFIIVTVNVSMSLSALLFWIQCTEPLAKSWTPSMQMMQGTSNCWIDGKTIERYNIFSGSYSAASDVLLALIPWTFLIGLQMKRPEKIGVGVAMSMGFLAGICAMVKTIKLPTLSDPDGYAGVELVIWDITEVAVTMAGACIPVLRVLIRQVRTQHSGKSTGASSGYGSSLQKDSKPRPPSWLPGWKGTSVNGASAVAFTGSKAKGLSPTSSSQTREPGEFDDDWSDISVLVPPPNASLRPATAGDRGILRTQDVRVESRRQSPNRGDDDDYGDDKMYEMGKLSSVV